MKAYVNPLSTNSKRVEVVAKELGLSMETTVLDFAQGQNRTPEYLAKNPMGKVPTFQDDDGWTLWESPAILVYLAEKNPSKKLWPADARGRADALRWMFWNASHLESALYELAMEKVIKPMMGGTTDESRVAAATKQADRYMPIWNAHMEGRTWAVGHEYSVVDIHLAATISTCAATGYDLSAWPHAKVWFERVTSRPAWK